MRSVSILGKINSLEIIEVKSELKQDITEIRGDIKTIDARLKNVEPKFEYDNLLDVQLL